MSRNINDLREGLFDALDMLKKGDLTVDQEKAISEMSQVIINSAKVEVDHIKATDGIGTSAFLDQPKEIENGVVNITRHRLAG